MSEAIEPKQDGNTENADDIWNDLAAWNRKLKELQEMVEAIKAQREQERLMTEEMKKNEKS